MYVISRCAKLHNRREKGRLVTINFHLTLHGEINFNRTVTSRTKCRFSYQRTHRFNGCSRLLGITIEHIAAIRKRSTSINLWSIFVGCVSIKVRSRAMSFLHEYKSISLIADRFFYIFPSALIDYSRVGLPDHLKYLRHKDDTLSYFPGGAICRMYDWLGAAFRFADPFCLFSGLVAARIFNPYFLRAAFASPRLSSFPPDRRVCFVFFSAVFLCSPAREQRAVPPTAHSTSK